jgi:mono/diheme cytochrome c family protein
MFDPPDYKRLGGEMNLSMKQTIKLAVLGLAVPLLALAILTWSPFQASASPDAAAVFKAKCAACHGPDGKGETPAGKAMKVRDLGSAEVQGQSDDALYEIVSKGKGKMPAYEKSLGADQCKQLVAEIRKFKR